MFPLVLVSGLVHGRYQYQDTLPRMMQDSLQYLDEEYVDDEPAPDTAIGSYDTDEPTVKNSIYFLQKSMQSNGGGPDSLQSKKLPDSLLKKLQGDDDFWYVNYVFDKKKREQKSMNQDVPLTESPLFQTLLWILIIGGFAAFVIIYLANSNVSLFRKKATLITSEEEAHPETDNIFEINYQREIDKAVGNGNYRFAVRLMFLRLLKNLSDKNIIQYKPDRTNFDYLLQLNSTRHYHDFFRLTRNYEYSWYGQFDIDSERFSWIRKDFENFDQKLK